MQKMMYIHNYVRPFTLTCAIVVTCFTTNPHVDKNIAKGIIWTITTIYIYIYIIVNVNSYSKFKLYHLKEIHVVI